MRNLFVCMAVLSVLGVSVARAESPKSSELDSSRLRIGDLSVNMMKAGRDAFKIVAKNAGRFPGLPLEELAYQVEKAKVLVKEPRPSRLSFLSPLVQSQIKREFDGVASSARGREEEASIIVAHNSDEVLESLLRDTKFRAELAQEGIEAEKLSVPDLRSATMLRNYSRLLRVPEETVRHSAFELLKILAEGRN